MMKEMRMTIDTETVGGCSTPDGAYHYGATVHNLDGEIVAVANILVMEHFDKIRHDDYAKKNFHLYERMIASGTVTCVTTEAMAVDVLRQLARKYNVKYIQAYNSGFDFVKTECSALLDEFQFVDLYLMALQTITHQKKYAKFCNEHGLYSKSGKTCATSVEAVYASSPTIPILRKSILPLRMLWSRLRFLSTCARCTRSTPRTCTSMIARWASASPSERPCEVSARGAKKS